IEQIYYEQWKETIDKKEDNNNFIIKGLQIKINDYKERLVNYSKMVKELQELKETINRQEAYITNLKYDEGKLKEERLTLKNNLKKLMQELQEMKNNQPIMKLPQKSNEEIPITEIIQLKNKLTKRDIIPYVHIDLNITIYHSYRIRTQNRLKWLFKYAEALEAKACIIHYGSLWNKGKPPKPTDIPIRKEIF